ncbi:MAG: copper chaperone PCu(A)C [Pseudomonadota bacterium]|nr:copper chaperone PCu(A)C [Pseudomonadota bacterium]
MTAGFARIENPCGMPLEIVGASSPAFSDVSLHETRIDEGISRMRAVEELHVPANGFVQLEPGGLHLMMMGAKAPLTPGSTVRIEFALKDGGTLAGDMLVQAAPP